MQAAVSHGAIGWSHKRGAAVVAAGKQQSPAYIGPVLAPKKVEVSFEDCPQADTGLQSAIIEQEGPAGDAVCTDDALVVGDFAVGFLVQGDVEVDLIEKLEG